MGKQQNLVSEFNFNFGNFRQERHERIQNQRKQRGQNQRGGQQSEGQNQRGGQQSEGQNQGRGQKREEQNRCNMCNSFRCTNLLEEGKVTGRKGSFCEGRSLEVSEGRNQIVKEMLGAKSSDFLCNFCTVKLLNQQVLTPGSQNQDLRKILVTLQTEDGKKEIMRWMWVKPNGETSPLIMK